MTYRTCADSLGNPAWLRLIMVLFVEGDNVWGQHNWVMSDKDFWGLDPRGILTHTMCFSKYIYATRAWNSETTRTPRWIYRKSWLSVTTSGHVDHPRRCQKTWNVILQLRSGQHESQKANILCLPSDSLLIDGGFSVPYHPCRVTLSQSIFDIKIHQATGAGATECHIPLCEWQLLMHGSPSWCWASMLVRPFSGSGSQTWASWLLAFKSRWSPSFITVVKTRNLFYGYALYVTVTAFIKLYWLCSDVGISLPCGSSCPHAVGVLVDFWWLQVLISTSSMEDKHMK